MKVRMTVEQHREVSRDLVAAAALLGKVTSALISNYPKSDPVVGKILTIGKSIDLVAVHLTDDYWAAGGEDYIYSSNHWRHPDRASITLQPHKET